MPVTSEVLYPVGIYALGGLITAGYLYRNGSSDRKRRTLQVAILPLWPVYWLLAFGIVQTALLFVRSCRTIWKSVEGALIGLYTIGVLASSPAYIYANWPSDGSTWDGLIVLLKSIAWAPFWPVYWTAIML